jgi:hypothetical protein
MHWFDVLAYGITGVCIVVGILVGVSSYKFYKDN